MTTAFADPGDPLHALDFEPQCEWFGGDGKHRCKNHADSHVTYTRPNLRGMFNKLACDTHRDQLQVDGRLCESYPL